MKLTCTIYTCYIILCLNSALADPTDCTICIVSFNAFMFYLSCWWSHWKYDSQLNTSLGITPLAHCGGGPRCGKSLNQPFGAERQMEESGQKEEN